MLNDGNPNGSNNRNNGNGGEGERKSFTNNNNHHSRWHGANKRFDNRQHGAGGNNNQRWSGKPRNNNQHGRGNGGSFQRPGPFGFKPRPASVREQAEANPFGFASHNVPDLSNAREEILERQEDEFRSLEQKNEKAVSQSPSTAAKAPTLETEPVAPQAKLTLPIDTDGKQGGTN